MNTPDKVKFNICNLHYAILNIDKGVPTWGTPIPIPGAVSFAMEPQGDVTPFYADGLTYYNAVANNGYAGDVETALFPACFIKDVFGVIEDDATKVLIENAKKEAKPFAFLFEENGDQSGTKFLLYNCTGTRPKRDFKTTTETKEPTTQTSSIKATSLENGNVLAMTQESTPKEILDNWYKKVFMQTAPTEAT